jgi:phosphatidylserine decarboxylase
MNLLKTTKINKCRLCNDKKLKKIYNFGDFLGQVGLVLSIWVYYFFRDPERVIIEDDNYLVSPADGEVIKVEEVDGPKELGLENKKFKKISIFMNVFDCHVNRTPCKGRIEEILYKPGKFFNASLDKASEDNERNYYKIKDLQNNDIIVVQIAIADQSSIAVVHSIIVNNIGFTGFADFDHSILN